MIDQELKEKGATIVVGLEGLKNKTPDWMAKVSNGIIFLAMFWALFSSQFTEIPADVQADISRYLLIGTGFVKMASKFFGLKLPNTEA